MTVDMVLKAFTLLLMFSSPLEVIKVRGELTECSKLTCFAKEGSTWFLAAVFSEIDDRCPLLSGIVGVLVKSKASWGREKISPIRRIQTPKKKKNPTSMHEFMFTIESESRTETDVRSTNCCTCVCMCALRAAAVAVKKFSPGSTQLPTAPDSDPVFFLPNIFLRTRTQVRHECTQVHDEKWSSKLAKLRSVMFGADKPLICHSEKRYTSAKSRILSRRKPCVCMRSLSRHRLLGGFSVKLMFILNF